MRCAAEAEEGKRIRMEAKEAELRILAKQARVDRVGLNVDENITNKYGEKIS